MPWTQTYDPLGSAAGSVLIAALPIATLLASIILFRLRTPLAALLGLGVALLVAVLGFHMPAGLALRAAGLGAAYGLLPIGWLVLNILFLYQITVRQGAFALLQRKILLITPDRRLQLLLIAFGFGSFFEGCAGFGAPVAITGAMLVGLGFSPIGAARLALIANTAPVAFGSLGTPIIALAAVTGLPLQDLSAMVGRQLPFFSALIPFWLIAAFAGWRGMLAVWPAILVASLSFAVPQFLVSNFHGPWLVDIVSATCSIGALTLFLRVWHPRRLWDGAGTDDASMDGASTEGDHTGGANATNQTDRPAATTMAAAAVAATDAPLSAAPARQAHERQPGKPAPDTPEARADALPAFHAWLPWLILCLGVVIWGLPATRAALDGIFTLSLPIAGLDGLVLRMPPVVAAPHPETAVLSLNLLSATGTGILLAALVAGLALGVRPRDLAHLYGRTLRLAAVPLATISAMLALGYVTRYSGTDTVLGLSLASGSGALYPFFGTLLGWLGVAATGSDTASNVLFGSLQKTTAQATGISPVLMAAANSSGGVIGKMADAQSIVVAATATGISGKEPEILRYVLFHSVALVTLVALFVLGQATVWPLTLMVIG